MSGMILPAIIAALGLMGCDGPSNDWSGYRQMPGREWVYADTLRFTPVHVDSLCAGRIVVAVRHDADFLYRELWIETTVKDGGRERRDTLAIPLADSFGRWQGCGIGTSFQITDTVERPFVHASGSNVTVRHIMRCDTLPGIEQVGLFFVPEPARKCR